MDLENIRRLVDQMLVQVQLRRSDQPAQIYDIIGDLEKLKTYFLTEAMQATMSDSTTLAVSDYIPFSSPLVTSQSTLTVSDYMPFPSPPVISHPTPMETTSQQIPLSSQPLLLQSTPPVQTTGHQILVSSQAAAIPMDVEQPQATNVPNQPVALIPLPPRPFARNPNLWQSTDENLFDSVSPPVLWFSRVLSKEKLLKRLPIPSNDLTKFIAQSPPVSFVHSGLFSGMSLPVTMYSRKIDRMYGGMPGLLVHGGGNKVHIFWQAMGKFFTNPSIVVNVLFHWKSFRGRYMLILYIDEDGSGPSGTGLPGVGSSGTGLAGVGSSGTGLAGVGSSGSGLSRAGPIGTELPDAGTEQNETEP